MHAFLTVTGEWRGSYAYPEESGGPWGVEVPFALTLREGHVGHVTGEVREDARVGFPEIGQVEGRVTLFTVSLEKRMPVMRFWAPGRLLTFQEWIVENYGSEVVVSELPHPTIRLVGRLSRWRGEIKGHWYMDPHAVVDDGSGWRLDFEAQHGRWEARRVRNDA